MLDSPKKTLALSSVARALVLASVSVILLSSCTNNVQTHEAPETQQLDCAQAKESNKKLTRSVSEGAPTAEINVCASNESGELRLTKFTPEGEWGELASFDGVDLPTEIILEEGARPAHCSEVANHQLFMYISGEWFHARSVQCLQDD